MTGHGAGLGIAAGATAAIVDADTGQISGQGLIIGASQEDAEPGSYILTCHHVIAPIVPASLRVRLPGPDGGLGELLPVKVVPEASDFEADVAVIAVRSAFPPPWPTLYGLDARLFVGPLDATGISYLSPARFDGVLRSASPLTVPVRVPGGWDPTPKEYQIPLALRLTLASDAREGISGSPVVSEGGIIGLAHFARAEGQKTQREVYVVPLSSWAGRLAALAEQLAPLVDRRLGATATVRLVTKLRAGAQGPDLVVAGYRPDVYLKRSADRLAAQALRTQRGAVVVGKPKSGKTRLALELLRADPERVIVIPRSTPPDDFEAAGLAGRPVTLLFDDLHRSWLTADPVRWVRLIADRTGADCLVLATSRDGDDWDKVKRQPGTADLLEFLGPDAVVYCSRQPDGGDDLSSGQVNALARELGLTKQAVTSRFDGTPGSLVLDLAAMKARYGTLRQAFVGDVAMSRLLDAAKLLDVCGQPQILLDDARFVAEHIRGSGPLPPELWEQLVRRTRDEGFGGFNDGAFQTYRPYLEECVSYEPSRAEAEQLFQWYAGQGNHEGVQYIGMPLHTKFDSPLAEHALRLGVAAGDAAAGEWLAVVLSHSEDREKQAEAERLIKQEIAAGSGQYNYLGLLYARQGRQAEAEEAYRAGIAAGEFICHFNLGNALAGQPGRLAEAESEFRAVVDAGFQLGAVELATVLVRQDRFDEAEAVLRKDIERWQAHPLESKSARVQQGARDWHALGQTLGLRGDSAAAADAFREAINLTKSERTMPLFIEANKDLGIVLTTRGQETSEDARAEAEECLRTAAAANYPPGWDALGYFLWKVLDSRDEAEEWLRKAAEAGLDQGHEHLGLCLLEDPARREEAITELRAAAEMGQPTSMYLLAWALAIDPGRAQTEARDAEAEHWLRTLLSQGIWDTRGYLWKLLDRPGREADYEEALGAAVLLGDPDAAHRLFVRQFGVQGKQQELEEALRASVAAGNPEALPELATVVGEDPDRQDEAEFLFTQALAAGSGPGHYFYGLFLVTHEGREADAERELRQAAVDGIQVAWGRLGELLSRIPGRESDAREALRRADEPGK